MLKRLIYNGARQTITPLAGVLLLGVVAGCKPSPYPSNPDYEVNKPEVRYTPERKNLEKMVKQLQGSPYVWAEEGPDSFDCSGFTYYLYGSMGIELPRVAREQAKTGKKISPEQLQYGDLIFFATNRRDPHKITHVGVYLGDGWFTHASTVKEEVIYSNLFTSPYYKKHLRVCRRYLPETRVMHAKAEKTWQNNPALSSTQKDHLLQKQAAVKQGKAIVINAPIQQLRQQHTNGSFYVQVGSFIGRPKSSLIYMITKQGFEHKIITFPKGGERINKLLIGPYKTRTEALSILKKVRASIQKDAFIAEIQ
jgi:cell division septation protein DedD